MLVGHGTRMMMKTHEHLVHSLCVNYLLHVMWARARMRTCHEKKCPQLIGCACRSLRMYKIPELTFHGEL